MKDFPKVRIVDANVCNVINLMQSQLALFRKTGEIVKQGNGGGGEIKGLLEKKKKKKIL